MKWFSRIILLLLLTPFIIGAYAYFELISHEPPSIDKAKYGLQDYYTLKDGSRVPTRYYYTDRIEIIEGKALLFNYWKYDGNKYIYVKNEKTILPPFDIVRRLK